MLEKAKPFWFMVRNVSTAKVWLLVLFRWGPSLS